MLRRHLIQAEFDERLIYYLKNGGLFASPFIEPGSQIPVMRIIGKNLERRPAVLDTIEIGRANEWESEHFIPVRVLNSPFRLKSFDGHSELGQGIHFADHGGLYELLSAWDYPFMGPQIGAAVNELSDHVNVCVGSPV